MLNFVESIHLLFHGAQSHCGDTFHLVIFAGLGVT